MNNAFDYKALAFWGHRLGSFRYYIINEQLQAAADGAPIDAIYKRGDTWVTLRDVTNPDVIEAAKKQGLLAAESS